MYEMTILISIKIIKCCNQHLYWVTMFRSVEMRAEICLNFLIENFVRHFNCEKWKLFEKRTNKCKLGLKKYIPKFSK